MKKNKEENETPKDASEKMLDSMGVDYETTLEGKRVYMDFDIDKEYIDKSQKNIQK